MSTPPAPRPVESVTGWAFDADVVVAGFGIAGVCAAIRAADAAKIDAYCAGSVAARPGPGAR